MTKSIEVDVDKEFTDSDYNFFILMAELKDRLIDLQLDIKDIKDPEVKGFAVKTYTKLKIEYFNLIAKSIELQDFKGAMEAENEKERKE